MQHNGAILRTSALGLALALLVVGMLSASAVLATPIASGNGAAAEPVYTTTNDATANAILWYTRAANGVWPSPAASRRAAQEQVRGSAAKELWSSPKTGASSSR